MYVDMLVVLQLGCEIKWDLFITTSNPQPSVEYEPIASVGSATCHIFEDCVGFVVFSW